MSRKLYLLILVLILFSLAYGSITGLNHMQSKSNNGRGNENGNGQDNDDPSEEEIQSQFQKFLQKNNKKYSAKQRGSRKAAFGKSLKEIKKLRRTSPRARFGINDMADWFPEEKQLLLGKNNDAEGVLSKSQQNKRQIQIEKSQPKPRTGRQLQASTQTLGLPDVEIPVSLDWREKGKVSPIKHQGDCGSCWAFAGTAHLEALFAIHENRDIDLSEQWALQCSYGGGCHAGFVWNVIKSPSWGKSIKTEEQYPYQANSSYYLDDDICLLEPEVKFNTKQIKNVVVYNEPSDEIMKRILVRQGPFAVAINANPFFHYEGGILDCSSFDITGTNHYVVVVGYDAEGNWIIKNSWGTDRGENGYITVDKNGNCNMQDAYQVFFENPENIDLSQAVQANFTLELVDSYGDGWNGNILGFKQNGIITHEFGADFTTGRSFPTFELPVFTEFDLDLVVVTRGGWSYECGYKIYDQNGVIVFEREAGKSSLPSSGIIATSPLSTKNRETVTYQLELSSSGEEGYKLMRVGFVQDGNLVAEFGKDFVSGPTSGPYEVTLWKGYESNLVVTERIYLYSDFIGFTLKDADGNVVYSKEPGERLYDDFAYYTFCAGCE